MKQNPVYNREMRVSSRSMKLPLIIFLFNGILFLVTLLNMYSVIMQVKASASIQYSSFMELYEFVTSMEFILLMFIVPAVTASAISGERERQTLDLLLILSSFPAVAMVFVYGGITWTDAFSLILCYVTVAFFAGSIGICFSAAFKRSTVSTVVTYGTLTAVVAGTYFLNRFALSVSGMDLQRSAAYVLGESSAKASSGGFFYLFLLNPAVTFMAVIGGQAGRGTPLADIVSYFGIPENGFIIKHWIGFSILIQLAAGMALINRAIHFVEPIKHKKTSRKGKK